MYRQIYEDLIRGISDGSYPTGSRLPSEKELADLYSVSRITSKKALEMLADRGMIMRKPGKGSFVLDSSRQNSELQTPDYESFADSDSAGEITPQDTAEKRQLFGVIMDMFDPTFGCELLQGIEYECRRLRTDLMLRFTYGSGEEEARAISDMRARGAQGILLMCSQNETYNENVLKLCVEKYPLVFFDRDMKGLPVPSATTDNYKASCELTEYLINKGHKKICFVSHSSMQTSSVKERFYGYRDTMGKHRLKTDENFWITDVDQFLPTEEEQGAEEPDRVKTLSEYIRQNPEVTAYYAVSFRYGNLICQILKNLGITDKEVVCFDGITIDEWFPPIMTHVEQDQFRMGVEAVRLLSRRVQGEEFVGRTLIPYKIIEV